MGGSSSQSSESQSYVFPQQVGYLSNTYNEAKKKYKENPSYLDEAQDVLNPLYDQATSAYGKWAGSNALDPMLDRSDPGIANLLQMQKGGVNPYLDQYYNAALTGLGNNLQRVTLPSIQDAMISAGQSGSSRHGIAEGVALSDYGKQAQDLAAQIYGGAYDADQSRRLQASGTYLDAILNAQSGKDSNIANLISGASNLYNLGMDPYNRDWQALQNYAAIIGRPTVLSTGDSEGSSWNVL